MHGRVQTIPKVIVGNLTCLMNIVFEKKKYSITASNISLLAPLCHLSNQPVSDLHIMNKQEYSVGILGFAFI